MYITLFLCAVALVTIYSYLTRNYNYWRNQKVPCAPNPLPGFGHALSVLLVHDNMALWAEKMYKRMGKNSMYGCYFVQKPILLIREPELIKTVLQTNFPSFRNNMATINQQTDPILYKNPFFAKDELWKEARTILTNNFSGRTLRSMFAVLLGVCDKFSELVSREIAKQQGHADFELKELFVKITGEIVANAVFGIEGQSFHEQPDHEAFSSVAKRAFGAGPTNGIDNALRFCFPGLARRLGVSLLPKETDRYFRQIMRTIIKMRQQDDQKHTDILQFIIDKMNEIDEDVALAQATSIFFDGYETSSSVMSFVVYRLAEHPEVQEKARREVLDVLERYDGKLSYESVKELNYLEQVMNEAMRLNPAIAELIKVCNEEITLQGSDGLKCTLKPGHMVMMASMGIHLDEEYWPNPTVFDPERFNAVNKNSINKYTYLAFGEGPRLCIGKRMAIMNIKTTMATILRNYKLEVSPKMKLPIEMNPNTFAWVAKNGLWVRFKPLNAND